MNKAKTMMTNRLSRTPTVPMMMLMISSAKSRMLGRYWCRASSSFDEDVVELFQTSLGNDAFSIAAKICLPQQLIDYSLPVAESIWLSASDQQSDVRLMVIVLVHQSINLFPGKLMKRRLLWRQPISWLLLAIRLLNPSTVSLILLHQREAGVKLTPRILCCILLILSGVLNAIQLISLRRGADSIILLHPPEGIAIRHVC